MMDDGGRRRAYLGGELARWRNHRGKSYRALAQVVPYTHGQLWKVEHGRANLTKELALACDRALNTRGALVEALQRAEAGYVPPAQLPIAPSLVGRARELAALRASDRVRPAGLPVVVAIDGPAGVGKTALALRWAHEIADAYVDGQLYADLRAFAPPGERVSAAVVLERFLTALGASAIPHDIVELAALYRSLVVERKVLVVLDNVAEVGDIEPLLPASAGCAVIVTSRRNLSGLVARVGASRVSVRPLTEQDAITLLSWVIEEQRARAEEAAVAMVARLCGYLPLALQMAAELIATSPWRPVADLVQGLIDDDHRLGELRAVFSWSYQDLGADAARLFRLMGLHRGPHLSVAAVAALADLRRPHARALLHRLASLHLVDLDSEDLVRMHDVVRVYARELATSEDDGTDRAAAVRRLADWYGATVRSARRQLEAPGAPPEPAVPGDIDELVFTDDRQATAWLDGEATNLRLVLALARDHDLVETAEALASVLTEAGLADLAAEHPDETTCCPLRSTVPEPRQYHGMRGEPGQHERPVRTAPRHGTAVNDVRPARISRWHDGGEQPRRGAEAEAVPAGAGLGGGPGCRPPAAPNE